MGGKKIEEKISYLKKEKKMHSLFPRCTRAGETKQDILLLTFAVRTEGEIYHVHYR